MNDKDAIIDELLKRVAALESRLARVEAERANPQPQYWPCAPTWVDPNYVAPKFTPYCHEYVIGSPVELPVTGPQL